MLYNELNELIKPNKKYKMSLCLAMDLSLPVNKDILGNFYKTQGGNFVPNENFTKLTTIVVTKSEKKNCVKEIISGIDIPVVLLISDVFDREHYRDGLSLEHTHFVHSVVGDTSNLFVAFAVHKKVKVPNQTDKEYVLKEVNEDQEIAYINSIHDPEAFTDYIRDIKNATNITKQQIKEKEKVNNPVLRLLKKVNLK